MKGTEKGCVMNQNDAQGAGDTVHQDAAEADTLDDRSAQDRKVQIAEMLAREQDPEHQARVAKADLAFARRTTAEEDLSDYKCLRKEALKKGDLQNFEATKAAESKAENELRDADQNIKELRGDYNRGEVQPALIPPAATPTVAESASGAAQKKWTPEKLAELAAYRDAHTIAETAKKFGISEQRIRQLLPRNKPKSQGYSAFTHRAK